MAEIKSHRVHAVPPHAQKRQVTIIVSSSTDPGDDGLTVADRARQARRYAGRKLSGEGLSKYQALRKQRRDS